MPIHPPPPILANARVLEYAILDESISFSRRTHLFIDGKELGPVPCLAICQNLDSNDIILLHCDEDWNDLGAGCYPSIEAAKAKAEQIYPGVSACWKPTAFTEAEARDYLTQIWADRKCSFCGRIPPQVEGMVEKNGVRICNLCLAEFQQRLDQQKPHR